MLFRSEPLEAGEADASDTVHVDPFTVYAISTNGFSSIGIDLGEDAWSGLEVPSAASALTFSREGDSLVINAPEAFTATIYRPDGTCAGTIRLSAGRNVIGSLPRGVYIIEGMKVLM